jgi:hypothetical protein
MLSNIDPGEAVLAIIGLHAVIQNEIPRWTLEKQRELDKLRDEIQELADEAIQGKIELRPLKREKDYDTLLAKIKEPLSPERIRAIQFRFPDSADEIVSYFIVVLQNSWAHLGEIFPVSEYLTFMGPKNLTPTGDKTWQFFNKLLVLNDPRDVFMLISSGAMLKSQAEVVKEFFPTLSQAITDSLYAAIAKTKAEDEGFLMPSQTSTGLANWLGRRTVDYDPNPAKSTAPKNSLPQKQASPGAAVSLSPSERVTEAGANR